MDDVGNRRSDQTLRDEGTVNFAVDSLTNRYTAIAGRPLSYDAAGSVIPVLQFNTATISV
jgi:hypothetical protein